MGKQFILFLSVLLVYNVKAQQFYFSKLWDMRFGGLNQEYLRAENGTRDRGIVVGGESNSEISGDKTQPCWGSGDYWVVKVNAVGDKEWDKRFGGLSDDALFDLKQTIDNGFILGGFTSSGLEGDITKPSRGGYDYWVVKIDTAGNKQWDKRFGGGGEDIFQALEQTYDGGYIFAGFSNSGIGGDKTEAGVNTFDPLYSDYWVVRTDSAGNKLWDKTVGGKEHDLLRAIALAPDGGFVLAGYSNSRIGGDKTEDNWDTIAPPTDDWWIVKIDSAGNKQWDKRYGTGNYDYLWRIFGNADGSYILAGGVGDTLNGDNTTSRGGTWIMKINSIGGIIWQVSYDIGGTQSLSKTEDGGYLIAGSTTRDDFLFQPPLDRTENCLGKKNTIVYKLDSNGLKQWDKTIFTTGEDYRGYAIQTNDGCYIVANSSKAGIGGYKTQAAWDSSYDYFIVKFCMDTVTGINELSNQTTISVFPNPFTSEISISLQTENPQTATFTITTLVGQTIYYKEESNLANNFTKVLDLGMLPQGVYFVTVQSGGVSNTKKVVKQ